MVPDAPLEILGVDAGGTFTDYVGVTGDGRRVRGKVSSTPDNPDQAIERILDKVPLAEDCRFVHGTTVATNALLEDNLADTVFVTNQGLEGLLSVGRGTRPELYELNPDPSTVDPFDVEVVTVNLREHPHHGGKTRLDSRERETLRREVEELKPEVVAVCLMHSYRDPELERTVRDVLDEVSAKVVLSSEVLPRFREYERASSTVVNAGLQPVIANYLDQLQGLDSLPDDHYLMGSDRGALNFEQGKERPALTVLSGPAGGVIGSRDFLENEPVERFISMDMGGTSTDVTAVDGDVPLRDDHDIGGYELAFPMVDVHTIGSGGGSIVWIDEANSLRVGPESAGADPGPACYGRGGPATLTDAQVLLGRIPPDRPLSEDLSLEMTPARERFRELGAQLDGNPREVASGALTLARTKLVEAVRSITVERGNKPSEFALIAHGGAGGLFAGGMAEQLNINTVYVPRRAGVASAAGLLNAPLFAQRSVSPLRELKCQDRLPGMERLMDQVPDWADDTTSVSFEAQCRFVGQTHTLGVPFAERETEAQSIKTLFQDEYDQQYGYRPDEDRVELVHLNGYWRSDFDESVQQANNETKQPVERPDQTLYTADGSETITVHDLEAFSEMNQGPTVLSGSTTTVYVPDGWTVEAVNDRLVRMIR